MSKVLISHQEDAYFHAIDVEKIHRLQEEAAHRRQAQQDRLLHDLHEHCCGRCGHLMQVRVFKGIPVEVCTTCQAVLMGYNDLENLAGPDRTRQLRRLAGFFHFTRE